MRNICLNYLYLSQRHAGGKDQVGINLLSGFEKNGFTKEMILVCYDYSRDFLRNISSEIEIISISSHKTKSEMERLFWLEYDNSVHVFQIARERKIQVLLHLSINNGVRKFSCRTILIPHDIKAISHRRLPGAEVSFYKYILYRIVYWKDFWHADKIIAISEEDKKEICHFFSPNCKKVQRIYNPIGTIQYENRGRLINEPYIIATNIQFLHKNTITLIKAFEKIASQIDYKLVLIGSVPRRVKFLKEYVKNCGLNDRIIFTGFVTEEEMYRWVINAELYVNPTLFEGFGMTAVEAMIWKVPVLVSGIPTNMEVTRGLCDYYYPPEDKDILADKILEKSKKKRTIDELKQISQEIAAMYDYVKIAKEYNSLFHSLNI